MNSGFFNVLCHSSHKGSSVLKVGVKVGLVDYGTSLSFYAWLLIRKRQLVQHFHVRQRICKCHLFRGHFQERQPLEWTIVIKISERNLGFMEETKTHSQNAIHFIRQTTPFWLTLLSKVLVFIYSRWRCTINKNKNAPIAFSARRFPKGLMTESIKMYNFKTPHAESVMI